MTSSIYSDINKDFQAQYEDSGIFGSILNDLILEGEHAVNNHIEMIISTEVGSRWWFPTFGADLERQLFEPMDSITTQNIYEIVMLAIKYWDPRVSIISDSRITPIYEKNAYEIYLHYSVSQDSTYWEGIFRGMLYSPT